MSIVRKFLREYQDNNPEKFNREILEAKKNDDVVLLIQDWCKSLEVINGITFISAKIINSNAVYNFKENIKELPMEESRLIEIEFQMKLEQGDKEEIITKKLFFPELLNNFNFLINDIQYYPIYQMVDAECYRTKNYIVMKTALQPVIMMHKEIMLKTMEGETLQATFLFSKMFSTKVPIFLYFVSHMGMSEMSEFFNFPFDITDDPKDYDPETEYMFRCCGTMWLSIKKEEFDTNSISRLLVATFMNIFAKNEKFDWDFIDDVDYWTTRLGSNFTKNPANHLTKGQSVQFSLERLMDETTKRISRLKSEDKSDIYHMIRWMILNYDNLRRQDNDNLANKRIRMNEYLLFPLYAKGTQGVLRILNGKNITIDTLKSLFKNIDKHFLVNRAMADDNMRYISDVNTIDITSKLRFTSQGPQAISTSKGEIRGRGLHETMIGRVDLIYTSNSNPGVMRMLTPMCKTVGNFHFFENPVIGSLTTEELLEEENEM